MRIEIEELYGQAEDVPLVMPGLTLSSKQSGSLQKRYGMVPVTVLHAYAKEWMKKKRRWIGLGIKGEEGRNEIATANNICSENYGRGRASEFYEDNPHRVPGNGLSEGQGRINKAIERYKVQGREAGRCFGQDIAKGEHVVGQKGTQNAGATGTSVFDPVLCECFYKWYGKAGGRILDPFAGGSTRGVVASVLGFEYVGVDIRAGQVEANRRQMQQVNEFVQQRLGLQPDHQPKWVHGDSTNLLAVLEEEDFLGEDFDFIWTCPPYYDLEIYSESKSDGSAKQTYQEFIQWYRSVFAQALSRLKPNRFAVVVIGEVRKHDGIGAYQNLERDTISVFEELGCQHYARFVLETAMGSIPIRADGQFLINRKPPNKHQMAYVFWKGDNDVKAIGGALGAVATDDIADLEEEHGE